MLNLVLNRFTMTCTRERHRWVRIGGGLVRRVKAKTGFAPLSAYVLAFRPKGLCLFVDLYGQHPGQSEHCLTAANAENFDGHSA